MQLDYAMQQKSGRSGRKFMVSKWSQDECVRRCVRKCVRKCVRVRENVREKVRESA